MTDLIDQACTCKSQGTCPTCLEWREKFRLMAERNASRKNEKRHGGDSKKRLTHGYTDQTQSPPRTS